MVREFKKQRRLLQRKRHMKIELCVKLSVLQWFQVGHLMYKIGAVYFRLLGTNVFHAKAKNERLSAASSRCRQNLKYENFTTSLADYVKILHQKACRTCSTIIFPHSNNQVIDLWRCRDRCRRHLLNSLSSSTFKKSRHGVCMRVLQVP